jgi:hypothetical protein
MRCIAITKAGTQCSHKRILGKMCVLHWCMSQRINEHKEKRVNL